MEQTQENLWYGILATIGEEGKHWIPLVLDKPEWELPKYAHQN